MPGPLLKDPTPSFLKEEPSVLEPAWEKGLRMVGQLLGLDDPFSAITAPMSPLGVGQGFGRGIKGFTTFGGKAIRKDARGVSRLLEGEDALRALKKMEPESPMSPSTVGGVDELSDITSAPVRTDPVPDLLGKIQGTRFTRTQKMNPSIVKMVRERFDAGESVPSIHKDFPDLSPATIWEVANRKSWVHVK